MSKTTNKAVVGMTLDVIKAKRSQKPEVRAAAREAALREIKERNKAKQAAKKAEQKCGPARCTRTGGRRRQRGWGMGVRRGGGIGGGNGIGGALTTPARTGND